jgi:hypothetical protein
MVGWQEMSGEEGGDEGGEGMRTKGSTRNDCEQLTILYSI